MIRPATIEDSEPIIDLGLEFLESSTYRQLGEGSRDAIQRLIEVVLEHGAVFVAEVDGAIVGMIALLMVPHLFSGETYCDEVAWFVKPDHRGRAGLALLGAAENWAVQNHAKMIKMVAPQGSTVGTLYGRRGYQVIESAYIKVLHGDRHSNDSRAHRADSLCDQQDHGPQEEGRAGAVGDGRG